ncbi:dTDP-4-dehydrorhamnose 3,5-epimerase [Jeongeupia wiesaeckerbachi]|uniref:dTDP-4-dehydrorhamnose 3,5-epimerase n=1 Tax=Jeongeupia wiesaeckerbachi TaxID=3051218 RepID=UPI003D80944A
MRVTDTTISDVKIIEPTIHCDDRGFFFESFNHNDFRKAIGREVDFVQDNHSHSVRGVLRGLHYQLPPNSQGKLVRCVVGEIFDVAVDIRSFSPTFGLWVGVNLSSKNKRQLWIPEGFAHGFLVLSEHADVVYKATTYYSPENESAIAWNDSVLNIDWCGMTDPILSDRDKAHPPLPHAKVFVK